MFTYRIAPPKATPDPSTTLGPFLSKEEILRRNVGRCHIKVGDYVRFKKPKRNPVYGTVVAIEDDPEKVHWVRGGLTPMNVVVDVIKNDKETGAPYGTERVRTNFRKLMIARIRRVV